MWKTFLGWNFETTDLEKIRVKYDVLPDCTDEEDQITITRAELDNAVKEMKKPNPKSLDIDGIPAEVWQNSAVTTRG